MPNPSKSLRAFAIVLVTLATNAGKVRSFATVKRSAVAPRLTAATPQQRLLLYLVDPQAAISEHNNENRDGNDGIASSRLLFLSRRRAAWMGVVSLAAATSTMLGANQALAAAAPSATAGLDRSTQKALSAIRDGQPLALNTKLSIQPEQRGAWIREIKALQKSTRNDEANSLQFSISEDVATPNTFYLHEQYKDTAAFVEHRSSAHAQRYRAFLASEKNSVFAKNGTPETYYFSPLEEGPDWGVKSKRGTPPTTAYCVTVNLYPKKNKREEFLTVIQANKLGTDTREPLALQYTFGESRPNVFHFHEEYKGNDEGKQGFEAHAQSPHFAGWVRFTETDDPFAKPPEVYFSRILE